MNLSQFHDTHEFERVITDNLKDYKGVKSKMGTIKEEAQASEPQAKTKNITELPQVSTDLLLGEESFKNKEGEEVTIRIIELNGEKYRVPQSVLNSLNVILEDNPDLKTFKVKKTGEGMDTRYTVIPLS